MWRRAVFKIGGDEGSRTPVLNSFPRNIINNISIYTGVLLKCQRLR